MAEFFNMGGYAAFVWPSWAIAVGVVLAITIISFQHDRHIRADLARLDTSTRTTASSSKTEGQ